MDTSSIYNLMGQQPPQNFAGIMKNTEVYIIPAKIPMLIGGQDPEDAGDQN